MVGRRGGRVERSGLVGGGWGWRGWGKNRPWWMGGGGGRGASAGVREGRTRGDRVGGHIVASAQGFTTSKKTRNQRGACPPRTSVDADGRGGGEETPSAPAGDASSETTPLAGRWWGRRRPAAAAGTLPVGGNGGGRRGAPHPDVRVAASRPPQRGDSYVRKPVAHTGVPDLIATPRRPRPETIRHIPRHPSHRQTEASPPQRPPKNRHPLTPPHHQTYPQMLGLQRRRGEPLVPRGAVPPLGRHRRGGLHNVPHKQLGQPLDRNDVRVGGGHLVKDGGDARQHLFDPLLLEVRPPVRLVPPHLVGGKGGHLGAAPVGRGQRGGRGARVKREVEGRTQSGGTKKKGARRERSSWPAPRGESLPPARAHQS